MIALAVMGGTAPAADTVVRRDGSRVEGDVLSVDAHDVIVQTSEGRVSVPRQKVDSILFAEPPAPPLKVEIRNVRSDDTLDVFVEGNLVLRDAREKGEWTDITPLLKDGNNNVRLRIHNARGIWAYHLNFRINGVVSEIACGTPLDLNGPCTCCGKTGRELGEIDDLPLIWLHVDRPLGTAEILH